MNEIDLNQSILKNEWIKRQQAKLIQIKSTKDWQMRWSTYKQTKEKEILIASKE